MVLIRENFTCIRKIYMYFDHLMSTSLVLVHAQCHFRALKKVKAIQLALT